MHLTFQCHHNFSTSIISSWPKIKQGDKLSFTSFCRQINWSHLWKHSLTSKWIPSWSINDQGLENIRNKKLAPPGALYMSESRPTIRSTLWHSPTWSGSPSDLPLEVSRGTWLKALLGIASYWGMHLTVNRSTKMIIENEIQACACKLCPPFTSGNWRRKKGGKKRRTKPKTGNRSNKNVDSQMQGLKVNSVSTFKAFVFVSSFSDCDSLW